MQPLVAVGGAKPGPVDIVLPDGAVPARLVLDAAGTPTDGMRACLQAVRKFSKRHGMAIKAAGAQSV